MNIKGLDKTNMPKVGDVISLQKEALLEPVESFTAQVVVQEHPGQLKPGFSHTYMLELPNLHVEMSKIMWKMGKRAGNEKIDNPEFLERGESAEIEFIPQQLNFSRKFDIVKV